MEYKTSDLLDIAIALEMEGAEFYRLLASLSKNDKTRKIFEKFYSDEIEHAEYFKKLKESFDYSKEKVPEDEDLTDLITQISRHNVLPEVPQEKLDDFHPLSAIKLGIKTEKNTLTFYKKLSKCLKDEEAMKAVNKLIDEERHHMEKLNEMYKNKAFSF